MKKVKNLINSRFSKRKGLEYFLLAFILALGFFIRVYKIENPLADWHSFRQADTASVSRFYVEEGINLLIPRYHDISRVQSGMFNPNGYRFVEFPIYNALQALCYKLIPKLSLEVWGRLISIISTLISALFILLIGRIFYSKWVGLVSAILFLFVPFNIYFSRTILPEPMAVMFGLMALYFFSLYSKTGEKSYILLFSLFLSLGILVKPYIVFYSFPFIYWILKICGFKKALKKPEIIISILIIVCPFTFWRFWMLQFPQGIPFWKWTLNGDGIRFRPAFFRWIFGERLGYLILGIWGLIPFVSGLLALSKKDWFLNSFLLGMLFYVFTFATANVRHDYYQTLIVPVVAFVFSVGVTRYWLLKTNRALFSRGMLVFSLTMGFLISWSKVRDFYSINHPEIIRAGAAVNRLTPKEATVIASYNGDTAFLYQTKRKGYPVVELPIEELINEGAEYYVSVNLNDKQTQDFKKRFKVLEETSDYVVIKLEKKTSYFDSFRK